MKRETIIALAEILVPVVQAGAVEVAKLVTTLKSDLTPEQLVQALEESRSSSWPELTFGLEQ